MLTEIQAAGLTLRGISIGGIYTSIHVPQLGALLDAGTPLRSAASTEHLFLSHGHVDHVGALPTLLGIRDLVGVRKPLRVFAPAGVGDRLEETLAAFSRLHRYTLAVEVTSMEPGDEAQLRADLHVRAFRTFHPAPSLGYLFFRRVDKLRDEFKDLPGPEIGRRRRAGEDLFRTVERHELAYATDTLPRVIEREPELRRARVLVLECTFLDDRKSVQAARAGGHIHLDDLLPLAESLENEAVVLMHISQLYKPVEAREILAARLPPALATRWSAFLPDADHWPG